jgi:hypothetical protein
VQSLVATGGALVQLNSRGELKRLSGGFGWKVLGRGVATFSLAADGTLYSLTIRGDLQRLTARDHWAVIAARVRSFVVVRPGDLYWLTDRGVLKRMKPAQDATTLRTGVDFLTSDAGGRVYALAGKRLTMYYALPGYYLLGPLFASDAFALDAPSELFVLHAANIVPPSDQTFGGEPEFPFSFEAAAQSARVVSPLSSLGDIAAPVTDARNVRIVVEKLLDAVDKPRIIPNTGPHQLHRVYYKCTVFYSTDAAGEQQRVVYIDKDHLHMVGGVESEG